MDRGDPKIGGMIIIVGIIPLSALCRGKQTFQLLPFPCGRMQRDMLKHSRFCWDLAVSGRIFGWILQILAEYLAEGRGFFFEN